MHVIICVHDSLRHDFVGVYNPDEQNTPHIDEFAKDAVVFTHAFSQTTWSKASGAAMLTGYYPTALGVGPRASKVPAAAFHLLMAIRAQGIKTIALSANSFISTKFGFGPGFDVIPDIYAREEFNDRPRRSRGVPDRSKKKGKPYVLLNDLNRLFFAQLDTQQRVPHTSQHGKGDCGIPNGVLGLIWSMDTHLPYFDRYQMDQYYDGLDVITYNKVPFTAPDVTRGIYRKMILYADEKFGELVAELKKRGIYEDAMIIVTGDHGESFGEHGQFMHSGVPYDQLTHVPLLIKFPQGKYGGTTHDELVELVDLMPTIAEQVGIDATHENPVHGRSLLRAIATKEQARKWIYSEHEARYGASIYTIRSQRYQYIKEVPHRGVPIGLKRRIKNVVARVLMRRIFAGFEELYDLDADPDASNNLIHKRDYQRIRREYQTELDGFVVKLEEMQATWGGVTEAEIDKVLANRLRDLGYIE